MTYPRAQGQERPGWDVSEGQLLRPRRDQASALADDALRTPEDRVPHTPPPARAQSRQNGEGNPKWGDSTATIC